MLEIRGARAGELKAAGECIGAAFMRAHTSDLEVRLAFEQGLHADTAYHPANTRLALLDGQIAGVAHIADRQMLAYGSPVRMGVLLWCGVYPEHQGRGIGDLLLMDTVRVLRRQGYAIALVFCEGVEGFYARAGWRELSANAKLRLHLSEPLAVIPPKWELRAGRPAQDLDAILTIHAQFNRGVSGPAVPSRDFWLGYDQQACFDYPLYQVALRDGRICAYLRSGHAHAIVEAGALPGNVGALSELVAAACRQAQAAGQVELDAVALPAVRAALDALHIPTRHEPVRGHLYRVIHPGRLLDALLPGMQARWSTAGMDGLEGVICLHSEAGDARLWVRGERLEAAGNAQKGRPALVQVNLSHAQAVALFLGQAQREGWWLRGSLPPDRAQAALRVLFPPAEFRWYPKDTF